MEENHMSATVLIAVEGRGGFEPPSFACAKRCASDCASPPIYVFPVIANQSADWCLLSVAAKRLTESYAELAISC